MCHFYIKNNEIHNLCYSSAFINVFNIKMIFKFACYFLFYFLEECDLDVIL